MDDLTEGPARSHRVRISVVTRMFFSLLGVGGLAVLVVVSYRQYRRTGTVEHDFMFAVHLPVYALTACVCLGLLRAAFSSGDWHMFAPSHEDGPEE